MAFLDTYTPITGEEGENRITIDDGSVYTPTIPVPFPSAATVASNGAKALYTVNGENPSSNFGRPIPDGDEIILTNIEQIQNLKIIRESDTTSVYIQFFKDA